MLWLKNIRSNLTKFPSSCHLWYLTGCYLNQGYGIKRKLHCPSFLSGFPPSKMTAAWTSLGTDEGREKRKIRNISSLLQALSSLASGRFVWILPFVGHFCELVKDSCHKGSYIWNTCSANVVFLSHDWVFTLTFKFMSELSHTDLHCGPLSPQKFSLRNTSLKCI